MRAVILPALSVVAKGGPSLAEESLLQRRHGVDPFFLRYFVPAACCALYASHEIEIKYA